jgi:hypothetical protein
MTAGSSNRTLQRIFHWFYLAVILFACFKLTYGITNNIDILFADESYYIKTAYTLNISDFFRDGFVYFLWLKLLSFFMPDMVTLYCWNYGLLMCLTPVLLYVLFRLMGRGYFTSAFISLLYLISTLNVVTWPFVTRFATAVILLIFIGVLKAPNNTSKYIVALVGLVLLIYSRPEFLLSFILFSVVSISFFFYRWFRNGGRRKSATGKLDRSTYTDKPLDSESLIPTRIPRSRYVVLGAFTLLLLIFSVFIKSPARQGRSVMAFGQHYGLHLKENGTIKENPWTDWRKIMKDRFQTDRSLFSAAMNNPGEIVRHIAANIRKFPKEFFYQLFPYNSYRFGRAGKVLMKWLIILMFSFAFFNFVLYMLHVRPGFKNVPERVKHRRSDSFIRLSVASDIYIYSLCFLLTLPLLAGMFVVYPRPHYMLVFLVLQLIWLVRHLPRGTAIFKYLGSNQQGKRRERQRMVIAGVQAFLLLVIVVFLPWQTSGSTGFFPGNMKIRNSYVQHIAAITDVAVGIPIDTEVRLFGLFFRLDFNYDYLKMYLENRSSHTYTLLHKLKEGSTFIELVKREKINMIYVNRLLRKHKHWSADPTLRNFIRETPRGWKRYDIPGSKEFLLVNLNASKGLSL